MTARDRPDRVTRRSDPPHDARIERDTIAAIATASGRAGIGVVRISGPAVGTVAEAIIGTLPPPRRASFRTFYDRLEVPVDRGLALYFEPSASYTGEAVLELQGHGAPVVLDLLLASAIEAGARLARPGEFTERAFLNGRLDLAQAEGVADLIESRTAASARAALRSLDGGLSEAVTTLQDDLVELRVWVESALDFGDEDIEWLAGDALDRRATDLAAAFDRLLERMRFGRRLREGVDVVIVGAPNAGKSSLLNAMSGVETAIVTSTAGTTRDLLHAEIEIEGIPFQLTDTAGLHASDDPIEQEGMRRARAALARADHLIVMIDATCPAWPSIDWSAEAPLTVVLNKIDLLPPAALAEARVTVDRERPPGLPAAPDVIETAIPGGIGLDCLRRALAIVNRPTESDASSFTARRRHVDALGEARAATEAALSGLRSGDYAELVAEELRLAQRALDRITGRFETEDLLGRIFSTFCIGK